MSLEIPDNLVHAAFFFVDIVGLSDPSMSTNTQVVKIKVLNESISECDSFKSIPKNEKIILPTGDGMAIGFLDDLEGPLQLAKELHMKLNEYNKSQIQMDRILVRIGCHIGNVFMVDDVFGNKNFWGPGLILARRVMDIGDAGHILMTSSMAESLLELSDDFKKIIHPLHDYQIKHGDVILLYSVHDGSLGNSKRPSKGLIEKSKILKETQKMGKTILYHNVRFNLKLQDLRTKLFRFTRTYELMNNSDEPIFQVVNGINTSVDKTFHALNFRAFDENDKELKILGINVDAPYRKEFTMKLNKPVFRNEKDRKYSITYECEEPDDYYENLFLINSEKFSLEFIFPTDAKLNPTLYAIQREDREKRVLDMMPNKKEGVFTKIEWKKDDGIKEKDLIRLEW